MSTWNELLLADHEITERVIAAVEKAMQGPSGAPAAMIDKLRRYLIEYVDKCHNMKEEKALFPLAEQRGIPRGGGPLAVMLAEHEQARALLARLDPIAAAYGAGEQGKRGELEAVFREYAALVKNHFWKETDILYPMASRVMSAADAAAVVAGIEELEASLGDGVRARYYAMADEIIRGAALEDLSFAVDRNVLAAILNTLPVELSFVDESDTVRYFSHEHGEKLFPRTRGVIGAKVQNCHPQKSVHMVNQILADFKAGTREVAEFWIDMAGKKIHIRYWSVKAPDGKYLGCLETVQDVTGIQNLQGQRRLLDPVA